MMHDAKVVRIERIERISLPAPVRLTSSREMRSISGTEPRKSLCDFSGPNEAAGAQAGLTTSQEALNNTITGRPTTPTEVRHVAQKEA